MEYPHFQYGKRLQRVGSGVGFPGVPIGLIIVNRDVTSNLFLKTLARNLPKSRKNIYTALSRDRWPMLLFGDHPLQK